MSFHGVKLFALLCVATPIAAQGDQAFDAATAFGARVSVANLSLSPDGQRVAYVAPHVRDGSPAMNADKIKVPVLLFHGALDRNFNIIQSKEMASRLNAAGVRCELVTWDNLDQYLEDSSARTEMLRKSDAFLRQAMGL
jgi:hypothetical protein